MIRQTLIKNKLGAKSVRWRKHDPTRIEGLTDAVFAFAVTLLVVSLEVPETFDELLFNMRGIAGFAICFVMIMLIWFDQYTFFRKYGLQDTRTLTLNSLLLFVILFYVYPLKFLFTFLTTGNRIVHPNGETVMRFTETSQVNVLMIIYGIGFISVYGIFFLLHSHALKMKEPLALNDAEIFNTNTSRYSNLLMMGIGTISLSIAIFGIISHQELSFFSGMTFALIGPMLSIFYGRRLKMLQKKFTKEELDALTTEVLTIEVKSV